MRTYLIIKSFYESTKESTMRAVRAVLSTVLKSLLNKSVVILMVLSRSPGFCIEDPKKTPIYRRGVGRGEAGSLQKSRERDAMSNTYWKSIERRIARLFGTDRIGRVC